MNYIDLDSRHRNRQQDPNPARFTIPFGPTSSPDPVLNGVITFQWSNRTIIVNAGNFKAGSSVSAPLLDLASYYPPIAFSAAPPPPQPIVVNAYNGYNVADLTAGQTAVIVSYQPSTVALTLNSPYTAGMAVGDPYYVYDLSQPNAIILPYVDNNGNLASPNQNAYAGYYLIDETLSQGNRLVYRTVTSYNANSRTVTLDTAFPFGWSIGDQFSLRTSLPYEIWDLQTDAINYTYINQDPAQGPVGPVITLPVGASQQDDFYKGKYIYYASNLSNFSPASAQPVQTFYGYNGAFFIKHYRGATRQAFVDWDINQTRLPFLRLSSGSFCAGTTPQSPVLSDATNVVGNQLTITQQHQPIVAQSGATVTLQSPFTIVNTGKIQAGSSATVIVLQQGFPPFAFSLPPTLIGFTFYHSTSSGIESMRIVDYDPVAVTVTLASALTGAVVGSLYEISMTTAGDSYVITTPSVINIVAKANDNVVPLDYIGSMVSTETAVCHTISLVSLELPNVTLTTGSQIAFYPYIYVEIRNATASERAATAITYSNNPAGDRALFIVPVTDVINPSSGYFVKLRGTFSQKIHFKPNDNLVFSVTLPNGEVFQTVLSDTLSPYPANPLLQIHALFSVKRL